MDLILNGLTVVAVSLGALFFLAGTIGLLRFPDTLARLHALSAADNLGLGLVVLGLMPQVTSPLGWIGLIAVWLLALLASGTVSQLLARAVRPADWHDAVVRECRDEAGP
jgi:multicomponent Na+:H+ antiporter subunit G